jgi:siroheme synthase
MPGQNYGETAGKLSAAGFAAETPCAIISRATTPEQRTYRTTVAELHDAPRLASPTLLVVGEVVKFAAQNIVEDLGTGLARTLFSSAETVIPNEEPLV